MKKILVLLTLFITTMTFSSQVQARSTKNMTIGLMAMGNIQLIDTLPEIDPGYGGGLYFDYRFNQRFSLAVEAWATTHDGTGRSNNDNGIELLGIPTTTLKLYLMDNESSKWDPYVGMGIGVYAVSEGSRENGTNGLGLGAQIDVGFDYYFTDTLSAGFAGVFRSAGIINSISNSNSNALLPFSLLGRFGYHF